jgi:hypothetical protein
MRVLNTIYLSSRMVSKYTQTNICIHTQPDSVPLFLILIDELFPFSRSNINEERWKFTRPSAEGAAFAVTNERV